MHGRRVGAEENQIIVKCAYCENYANATDYPHIEHFYPKSRYPKFCFKWSNLLIACHKCNVSFKNDKFPILVDDICVDEISTERSTLCYINPAVEDPDDFLHFKYDSDTKKALLFPKDRRVARMVQDSGLNERPTLIQSRSETVERLYVMAILLTGGTLREEKQKTIKELFKAAVQSQVAFSAFARAIVRQFNIQL
jgi:uncharacterized protein (TIGR02646 family)